MVSGSNATTYDTKAVVSLKGYARSDARAALVATMRSVVGRLSAAVDSQNGIDVASVVALLEAARSSIIGARKAPSPQQFMHRCVACGGGSWLGFEAPWW